MKKQKNIEIMAPVGDFESLGAAIKAGAGAVYFGVQGLNMRNLGARNFTLGDLKKIVKICKVKNIKTYLTVNTILYDRDMDLMEKIMNTAKKEGITAIIASDIAAIQYANSIGVEIHISTQLNVSNIEAVKFYSKFADVIVLARELELDQIKKICDEIQKQNITGPKGELVKVEIFVHGALCVAISGQCYMSLASYNKSANRGECLQACRRGYKLIDEETGNELKIDNRYVMSPKDLCCIKFLDQILDAGVSVLKIEGRARSAEYVYTVVKVYKEAVESVLNKTYASAKINVWITELETVFNRGFWHGGYYLGKKIEEWGNEPDSRATKVRTLMGFAENYYSKSKIAHFKLQNSSLKVGDEIMITGPTTGLIKTEVKNIHVGDKSVKSAKKGEDITIPVAEKVRKNDKLYLVEERSKLKG